MNDSTWTWMGGSNGVNDPGVYGEQGVANTSYWPRSRLNAVGWFDRSTGELWLFGGSIIGGTHWSLSLDENQTNLKCISDRLYQ